MPSTMCCSLWNVVTFLLSALHMYLHSSSVPAEDATTFLPSAIHCIIGDVPRWYPTVPGCVREDRTTEYLHLGSAPRQYPLVPRCVLNSLAPALYLHSGFGPSVPCGAQYEHRWFYRRQSPLQCLRGEPQP